MDDKEEKERSKQRVARYRRSLQLLDEVYALTQMIVDENTQRQIDAKLELAQILREW